MQENYWFFYRFSFFFFTNFYVFFRDYWRGIFSTLPASAAHSKFWLYMDARTKKHNKFILQIPDNLAVSSVVICTHLKPTINIKLNFRIYKKLPPNSIHTCSSYFHNYITIIVTTFYNFKIINNNRQLFSFF